MPALEGIVSQIRKAGFRCRQCGSCCRGADFRVMVYPAEVREITQQTGLFWEDVAEPYPEEIFIGSGQRVTFEWALRVKEGACLFLQDAHCRIHPFRPWICRTYPFYLNGRFLQQSVCPGLGEDIPDEEARFLARDLTERQRIEKEEENRIRAYSRHIVDMKGRYILIDGDGVKVLEP